MRFLSFVLVLPFLALSYLPAAEAHRVSDAPAKAPVEDASVLPWHDYVRDAISPAAAVQLLATVHVGTRIQTFSVPVSSCAQDIQAVQVKVLGASVTVPTFGLQFTDGSSREFNVNKTYAPGTDSGWIDLGLFRALDNRCPVAVHASARADGAATVLVYGNFR